MDPYLEVEFDADTHVQAKQVNKIAFQARTGLKVDQNAPLFFWPSRLDPVQKGCQLLADVLYELVHRYWEKNLQIAIVANGSYQKVFRDIVAFHDFYDRVTVCDFRRRVVAPGLRRLGLHLDAFALRALRPAADDLPVLRQPAGGSRHRRSARHG